MARTTTVYDLLLSCPGDVVESCLPIIKDAVETFNKIYGVINNVTVMVKHWSTDSFPQSGDAPQELLNKQFIRDCDAAVAIFWTRFGTPTERYGSGTEEEIEEMITAGKQVFLYFYDKAMPPSQMQSEEYKKVQQFKEKYKDHGIYSIINNASELRQQFTTHLGLYFLKIITNKSTILNSERTPILSVTGRDGVNKIELLKYFLSESKTFISKRDSIITKIEKAKAMILPERTIIEAKNPKELLGSIGSELTNFNFIGKSSEILVYVNSDVKDNINRFCNEHEIAIDSSFWNVGNLVRQTSRIINPFGGSSLAGTNEEIEKYQLIEDIEYEILCLRQYQEYYKALDSLPFAEFIVNNSGTMHDEDIDVKIIIPKGCILNKRDIPIPGDLIISDINETEFLECCFCSTTDVKTESYSDYPPNLYYKMPGIQLPFQTKSVEEDIEENQNQYTHTIDHIFCYSVFSEDNFDVWEFNIKYLKQHKSIHFPTLIFFKEIPDYIEYELSSKNSSNIIKGKLTFKS